jgi:hypothetical protein
MESEEMPDHEGNAPLTGCQITPNPSLGQIVVDGSTMEQWQAGMLPISYEKEQNGERPSRFTSKSIAFAASLRL